MSRVCAVGALLLALIALGCGCSSNLDSGQYAPGINAVQTEQSAGKDASWAIFRGPLQPLEFQLPEQANLPLGANAPLSSKWYADQD